LDTIGEVLAPKALDGADEVDHETVKLYWSVTIEKALLMLQFARSCFFLAFGI
jgi:hypothetical protein